jgi:hypothetical protein
MDDTMTDRTTKLLMAAIATGLLWNAAMLTVKTARADDETDGQTLGQIATELSDYHPNVHSIRERTNVLARYTIAARFGGGSWSRYRHVQYHGDDRHADQFHAGL